ncbi:MAG: DUF3857 domain-containing protein, partial [Sphingobacteriales bacterium]
MHYDFDFGIVKDVHKRNKIFNENGKSRGNIRILYFTGYISNFRAQTINMVDGKKVVTKIDKGQVFTEKIDKWRKAMVFTFPDIKPGSVIEYEFNHMTQMLTLPAWFFQEDIPVRYSELITKVPTDHYYRQQARLRQPLVKNTSSTESLTGNVNRMPTTLDVSTRALANVPSLPYEPFMSSQLDNFQSIYFILSGFRQTNNSSLGAVNDTWAKIGGTLADEEDFGRQLKKSLLNEQVLIAKAATLKTDDQKIAYLFNEVKGQMKWNRNDSWYTNDGVVKAWEKKIGNATEINLVLYNLLHKAGITAYPMVVSTRDHGKVYPSYTFIHQFNRGVVYIPVDSTRSYVLDASNKYNLYNQVPDNLLNSSGLYIDKENNAYDI